GHPHKKRTTDPQPQFHEANKMHTYTVHGVRGALPRVRAEKTSKRESESQNSIPECLSTIIMNYELQKWLTNRAKCGIIFQYVMKVR
ncbi:MAG TPA: hypothetical protein DHV89_01445, partial [Ruminococcus sp.]|nr:hypothetical protein [Ruminococcus sp.]